MPVISNAIAGDYVWSFGTGQPAAADLIGITADAATFRMEWSAEEVRGDNLGDTIQDGIYRGGNCYLELVLQEWNKAIIQKLLQPVIGVTGDVGIDQDTLGGGLAEEFGLLTRSLGSSGEVNVGSMGCLWSRNSAELIGRPVGQCARSIPAEAPATQINAQRAVLAPNFPIEYLMGSRLRNVPIRFLCLPFESATVNGGGQLGIYAFKNETIEATA